MVLICASNPCIRSVSVRRRSEAPGHRGGPGGVERAEHEVQLMRSSKMTWRRCSPSLIVVVSWASPSSLRPRTSEDELIRPRHEWSSDAV